MTRSDWRQGLLVSVRDHGEASAAVAGGAAIIDVKEPSRGPLGRADAAVAAAVAAASGSLPVTIAVGELADGVATVLRHVAEIARLLEDKVPLPRGVKVGPAGLSLAGWRRSYASLLVRLPAGVEPVAVAYADWRQASSPRPEEIAEAAVNAGGQSLLVDTFDKQGPGLFSLLGPEGVARLVATAKQQGLAVALAGRLQAAEVPAAFAAGGDVVGVRSAACGGRRDGVVTSDSVRNLATLAANQGPVLSPADPS